MKAYSDEELERGGGRDPENILVAVEGKVYNVAKSHRWAGGRHMLRHAAGSDLTEDIKHSPHGHTILERFEAIGTYERAVKGPPPSAKGRLDVWLQKHPFFLRHPHPALAHAPIGLMPATVIFEVLALAFGSARTEWAVFCCLVLVLLALPVTMVSEYFTWWLNFDSASVTFVVWKQRLAWTALAVAVAAVLLRVSVADPLALRDPLVLAYVALVLLLAVLVSIIGYLGGRLTFPYE